MKKLLRLFTVFAAAILLFGNTNVSAQTGCLCEKGNQDYVAINVYLGDAAGVELPAGYQCAPGTTAQVYIWASFIGNATRYSLYAEYQLFLDNVFQRTFSSCILPGQAIPTNTPILIDALSWECGAEVKLSNYFMSWQTNGSKDKCGCDYQGCYGLPELIVRAPLIPRMSYTSECSVGDVAQTFTFEDNSTGGYYYKTGDPYSYLWNFGSPADYTITDGTLTSSPVEVKFLTSGVKTVTLTVTDSTMVSKTLSESISVGACFHLTASAKPGTFECSDDAALAAWLATAGGATVAGGTGTVTWSYAPYALAGGCAGYTGTAMVTFTATDEAMQTVTTSALLTITDTTDPLITKEAVDEEVECDGAGNVTAYNAWLAAHAGATATDNCDATLTWSYVEGTWEALCGNTKKISVTFHATDDCGNQSSPTTAVFSIEDKTAPVITKQAVSETVECDGTGNTAAYTAWIIARAGALASDACGGELTWSYSEGTWSDGCGLTKAIDVTFYVTDGCTNKSAGTTATFTIVDTTKPAFACPANISVPAEEGETYGVVTVLVPQVTEACGTVSLTNSFNNLANASGNYPLGSTLVIYTAVDECGNTFTCSFTVTVLDEEAPGLTCPGDITGISCSEDLPAPYADYDAFIAAGGMAVDNQGINEESFMLVSSVTDEHSCPETITRVYQIADTDGNTASCTQIITVDDNTNPQFVLVPADVTVECDGTGNANALGLWLNSATANDNCGEVNITHNYGMGEGMVSLSNGCGTTGKVTVTWTAEDACGNKAVTSASFTIVDTTGPSFTVPADITIQADENCEFDASPETLDMFPTLLADNCTASETLTVTYSDVITKGTLPGEQVVTRTWTVTDPCGNKTVKAQVIKVLGGNAPPELQLHEICVYLSKYGKWTLNQHEISQMTAGTTANCGATTDLEITVSPRAFDCFDVFAKVPVLVTAKDYNGNTATGTTYVTVMDTLNPVAVCQDVTVHLDKFGQAHVAAGQVNQGADRESVPEWAKFYNDLEGGSYDNCGIAEMYLSRNLYTCADLGGPKQVTLSVIDPSGNVATCKAMVTVLDTIKPVITPVVNLTVTVEPGVCTTKVTYPAIVVKDNCGVVLERLAGLGPDGMFPLGTTLETWKASNMGGTFSQISFNVTVNTYNGAPAINTVADVVVNEDAAAFEIPLAGIGYGVDCVAQQVLSLDVTNSNTGLLTVVKEYVNGEATGKLKITLLANKNGEALITLTVKDNGGTANGGVDTTVKTFKITVVPVNDPPVVTPVADQFVTLPNSLSVNLGAAFSDIDAGDVLTHVVTLANGSPLPAWMTFNPLTGMLTGTPAATNLGVVEIKVVATDKAGASVQDQFLVVVLDPNATIINGSVVKGTTPLTGGIRVVLFAKVGTMFNAISNTTISSAGTFSFYNVPNGTYLVKAEVTDQVLNPGLLHTYYESAASVTTATQLAITAPGTKTIKITMVPSTIAAGEFKIMGKVVRKTGTPELIIQGKDPVSTPAPGIDMVLKQNGTLVANTVTGADGTYAFANLPAGTYDVFVELPGYTQDVTKKVTLDAANPLKDKVDFTIWTADGTHIITNIEGLSDGFAMQLYPNPTSGRVNIDITWNEIREVEVSVFNIQGAQVFRKAFYAGEQITFDLSENASGMYMVKIDAGTRMGINKLIIDKR